MYKVCWYHLATMLMTSLVGGCAEGDEEPSNATGGDTQNNAGSGGASRCKCQPGAIAPCSCVGDKSGTRVCQFDCMTYSVCDCSAETGGTGGIDAGEAGTGGTGTAGIGTGGTGTGGTGTAGIGTGGTGTGGTGTAGIGTGGTGTGGTGTGGTSTAGSAGSGGVAGSAGVGGSAGSDGVAGSAGSAGSTGFDVCPGEEIVLTGSGIDPRVGSATGDTSSLTADYNGSCGTTSAANDAVFFVTADVDGHLKVDLGGSTATTFDSKLYARSECDNESTEIDCDDVFSYGGEILEFDVTAGSTYYLFVDAYNTASGPFTVNVELLPKGCGNGIVESPAEECDDGNDVDSDWCKNDCTINPDPVGDVCPGVELAMSGTGTDLRIGNLSGDTSPFSSTFSSTCASSQTSAGRDMVAFLTSDVEGIMTCVVQPETGFDVVLSVRSNCSEQNSELECKDISGDETVVLPVVANQTYYIIVDG